MRVSHSRRIEAASSAVALFVCAVCACAPCLAAGAWGPPGNVVPNFVDPGPPASCFPPYSPIDLDKEYDVFDKLHVNQIIALAVATGSNPYVGQLSPWAIASWNAIAAYDCSANPAIETGVSRRPVSQRNLRNRNKAQAAALLRMHELVDPVLGASSRALLADSLPKGKSTFKLSPDCSGGAAAFNTPECVGIRAANVTYNWFMAGGWNFDGAKSRKYNKSPYTDYVGYTPKNTPWDLAYPCNWQPLHETDRRGKIWIQTHMMPYLPNVTTFFVNKSAEGARTVPMWDCANRTAYKAQVDEILRFSAALTDATKMQAELLGPQPFCLFTVQKLRESKGWSITDVAAFNLMSVIYIDLQASVIAREKIRHDGVRPASAVRYWYGDTTVTAYAGVDAGVTTFPGKDWLPYLSTFNEAEFPSGAICWCTVLNEWIELWQGGDSNPNSNKFNPPLNFTFQPGCSMREPYATPKQPVSITIATTQEYIQKCKDARVYGGVHFRAAMNAGYDICKGVTKSVWGRVKQLYPKLDGRTC
ncbi:hypothetical protein Agub_g2686 [Astrephomene gubernaculifera]|uniref:Uncharacterized protein n=1 Tax=Astrephomene gubernaculifera TaxID=47775 RepID=A0AAD3DJI3_9CHLO|nr:hypothetical protein Agub_g2686 [Astrephomene gubernaculifera]